MESLHNSLTGLSIMIVEDDTMVTEILGRTLSMKFPGVSTSLAVNGKLGLQLFKENPSDIVITDFNMPEMDGSQMAREIKSINNDVKFIVITGFNETINLESFRDLGIGKILVKPIVFAELFALVEKCIDEIQQQRQ